MRGCYLDSQRIVQYLVTVVSEFHRTDSADHVLVSKVDVWCPDLFRSDEKPCRAGKLAFVPHQSIIGPSLYTHVLCDGS